MKIAINGKIYKFNAAAITPVRYRSFFGRSFLAEYIQPDSDVRLMLQKLLYIAMWDFDVPFSEFQAECAEDENFLSSAILIKECIFEHKKDDMDVPPPDEGAPDIEFDEFLILAQMGDCHLPERLLDELSLFQIIEVIRHYYDMKNPQQKPKVLQPKERKAIFGISPEVEAKIRKALGK